MWLLKQLQLTAFQSSILSIITADKYETSDYNMLALFKGGVGQFKYKFQVEGDTAIQPLLMSEKLSDYPFTWYQNIDSIFFHFVTKHACDGQTDRQNCTH